ncbi:MFS transporter [Colwellia sp. E2M01]|uniref:MFS transporter n=1 Tax=Colwellia sp. E2M01 TaxID=2841561 RepID=UPI001C09308B|nr:MFS transporter [Colwellia sp. E2M01]MBU2869477.1 MFS transporter [Colwellia sp. E2M01]
MLSPTKNAFLFAFIIAFGGFVFGLDLVLISGTIQFIKIEFGLSAIEIGNLVAGPGYGALIGLIFTSLVCDKIGRKKTMLIIAGLYSLSAIGSAYAPSANFLFWSRVLGGLAFASLSVASMYIGEVAPPKYRGKLVGMNQLNIVIGIFVAQLVNFYIIGVIADSTHSLQALGLNEASAWRWMLGFEIVPAVVWFLAIFILPESPRWLALNGKMEQTKQVMAKITEPEDLDKELQEIDKSFDTKNPHSLSTIEQAKIFFSPVMRTALVIGVVSAMIQALTGINSVLAYMPMIFSQLGGGEASAFSQTLVVGGIGLIFTILGVLCVDKLGRRPIFAGGLLWGAFSLLLIVIGFFNATYLLTPESVASLKGAIDLSLLQPILGTEFSSDLAFKQAVIEHIGLAAFTLNESDLMSAATNINGILVFIGIISLLCAHNFSMGPILWILLSEIFPTKVRAFAIPFCGFIASVFGGVIVPLFFPWQLETLGAAYTFALYMVFSLLGLAFVLKKVPETKNKTIEEIELELSKK